MSSKKRSRFEVNDEYIASPEEEDELEASNLQHVEPYQGMRLEIRDSDYIWSAGYIVSLLRTRSGKTMATVASDGWGREWDELMEWPNDRIAKLYTYTKQVKCNLDLLSKKKGKYKGRPTKLELEQLPPGALQLYSSLWPVSVQFRMPHPGVKHARESLRLEDKVFVKPYGMKYLPDHVLQLMVHDGGCWFHHSRLRLWKDDPSILGVLHKDYMHAFKLGQDDKAVKGFLLPKALETNSLLNENFRVHHIRGCDTFDGVLRENEPTQKRLRTNLDRLDDDDEATGGEKPPSVVAIHTEVGNEAKSEPEYSDPPTLPPPIRIKHPLYPRSGVSKCKQSNQWVASVSMNGNQVFLGSFPTESQAWIATRKATGDTSVDMPKTTVDGHQMDLQTVSMEAIIDAYEDQFDPMVNTFSLHNWTLAKINHHVYLKEKRENAELPSSGYSRARRPRQAKRKGKRKGVPRKLASL